MRSLVLSNKTVGLDAGRPDGGLLHIKLKWTGFRASADERLSLGMQPKHDAIRKVQAILRHQPGLTHATSATGNELASATSASSASELGPPECRHIRTGTGLAPAISSTGTDFILPASGPGLSTTRSARRRTRTEQQPRLIGTLRAHLAHIRSKKTGFLQIPPYQV